MGNVKDMKNKIYKNVITFSIESKDPKKVAQVNKAFGLIFMPYAMENLSGIGKIVILDEHDE